MNSKYKNTIELGIIPQVQDASDLITDFSTLDSITGIHTVEETTEEDQHFVNTEEEFGHMMRNIIKAFKDYVEKLPQDEYSRTIIEWFNKGLHDNIKRSNIYHILDITSDEDLFMLLMLSPELKNHMQFTYDAANRCIKYSTPTYEQHDPETQTHTKVKTPTQLEILHKHIYHILYDWVHPSKQHSRHYTAKVWRNAIQDSMSDNSTWRDIQQCLAINEYYKYCMLIQACPTIKQHLLGEYWQHHVQSLFWSNCDFPNSYSL
jgi:hypothetical protein